MWRGLEAMLAQIDAPAAYREAAAELSPAVLSWLAVLRFDEYLPADFVVRTRAIGISYGSQSSVVDEIMSDSLIMHSVVLGERGSDLRLAAVAGVGAAEAAVRALGDLAGNLAIAAGGDGTGDRERARELGFFGLDNRFRTWLEMLTLDVDSYDLRTDWEREVHQLISSLGDQLIAAAGIPAWIGREHRGRDGQSRQIDASLAAGWFTAALSKALPLFAALPAATPRVATPAATST